MPQVLIREIEPEVVEGLKSRARRNGRSLEAELRVILRQAAGVDFRQALEELNHIRARFPSRVFSDSAELIREDRERE